jgi:transposase
MKTRRKTHTVDYEAKIVVEAIKGNLTVNQLASKYGIHPNMITEWTKQALDELPQVLSDWRGREEKAEDRRKIRRRKYDGIEIECICANPPWGLFRHVKMCLNWINNDDLQGLEKIILTDEMKTAEVIADNHAQTWRGLYNYGTEDSPSVIFLMIPELYLWVPSWLWWSPVITLRICDTLAHEVGHHVSFMHDNQIVYAEASQRESLADNYANSVIELMTRHWYYKMARFLIKDLAGWYFAFGLSAAHYGRYQRAAKRFYAAWHLMPEMKEAAKYYWRARRTYEKEVEQENTGNCER